MEPQKTENAIEAVLKEEGQDIEIKGRVSHLFWDHYNIFDGNWTLQQTVRTHRRLPLAVIEKTDDFNQALQKMVAYEREHA